MFILQVLKVFSLLIFGMFSGDCKVVVPSGALRGKETGSILSIFPSTAATSTIESSPSRPQTSDPLIAASETFSALIGKVLQVFASPIFNYENFIQDVEQGLVNNEFQTQPFFNPIAGLVTRVTDPLMTPTAPPIKEDPKQSSPISEEEQVELFNTYLHIGGAHSEIPPSNETPQWTDEIFQKNHAQRPLYTFHGDYHFS